MSLFRSSSHSVFNNDRHEFVFTTDDFTRICDLMYQQAGICLSQQKAEMVYNRLSRRLRALELQTFSDYLDLLDTSKDEWKQFVGALTTHLTSFFREAYHFPIISEHALKCSSSGRVKLWSCAASTGEEPYSMAIAMAEQFKTLCPPVDILATDIDAGVLETARLGVYPLERIQSLPAGIKQRYFLKGDGKNSGLVKIIPELQQMVSFRTLNLLDPVWPLSRQLDGIFCRNVMIYFDRPTQKRVLQHCLRYLAPDGLFFAGHSENLNHFSEIFAPCGRTVYRPHYAKPPYLAEPDLDALCYA